MISDTRHLCYTSIFFLGALCEEGVINGDSDYDTLEFEESLYSSNW